MKPSPQSLDITPERIAEITRRAHRERSQAMWRLLQGIFRSRAADDHLHDAQGVTSESR